MEVNKLEMYLIVSYLVILICVVYWLLELMFVFVDNINVIVSNFKILNCIVFL